MMQYRDMLLISLWYTQQLNSHLLPPCQARRPRHTLVSYCFYNRQSKPTSPSSPCELPVPSVRPWDWGVLFSVNETVGQPPKGPPSLLDVPQGCMVASDPRRLSHGEIQTSLTGEQEGGRPWTKLPVDTWYSSPLPADPTSFFQRSSNLSPFFACRNDSKILTNLSA